MKSFSQREYLPTIAVTDRKQETEIAEEEIENLSLRYITLRRKNDEIRQNYYFFANLKDRARAASSNEGRLEWFGMDELLENMPEMPFTANYVVKYYVETGKDTDVLYAGIAWESGGAASAGCRKASAETKRESGGKQGEA